MIRLQTADFDCGAEINRLSASDPEIGAVVSFTGIVRPDADGRPLRSLTLEHYPGMTETELDRVDGLARTRWPLNASLVIHRYGTLVPGDRIVLVVTASAHREDAFAAAAFLMDYLKVRAPFWKKEQFQSGEERWVAPRNSDDEAAGRWAADPTVTDEGG